MTKTYPVEQMKVNLDDDVYAGGSKWTYQNVADAQTILKNYPLSIDALGRFTVWAGAGTLIAAFAMQDAESLPEDTLIKTVDVSTVKALGGIEANLVASANVIAPHAFNITNLLETYDLVLDTATGFWVIDLSTGGAGGTTVRTWDRKSEFLFPDEEEDRAENTDINARLYCKLLAGEVLDWT